jgi:hypothetical protein
VRPSNNLKDDNCLAKYPATAKVTHKPVDIKRHSLFSGKISSVLPQHR